MKVKPISWLSRITLLGVAALLVSVAQGTSPIESTVSAIAGRLTEAFTPEELRGLTEETLRPFVKPAELRSLASEYWRFDVNVPVVVSVMRDANQTALPFWLEGAGFAKADLVVRNEYTTYEVWQRAYDAGSVGLGINGFDKHRPHYFVSVGAQDPDARLELTNFVPEDQQVFEMGVGASIYHDWPELVLSEVPEALEGQALLPTIRGRAREAHLIGAFRETAFPSAADPDQVLLTWNGDPRTSMAVQWRTSPSTERGFVCYREADAAADAPWSEVVASMRALDDPLIINERRVHRFTATLSGLKPGTAYAYRVGDPESERISDAATFQTAPATPEPFTFFFLSDTHNSPAAGALLDAVLARDPDAAFALISGDLVGTGQYRDDWDNFFAYGAPFMARRPVMPSIGNHDAIDGLGADLYLAHFELPENGPASLAPQRTYAFEYGNAIFLMMDVTEPIAAQTSWIDAQLEQTSAKWNFAVMHFPPYFPEDSEAAIREAWIPVLDRHHVDFALAGHVHTYMRSHPMRGGECVASPAEGTTYLITISLDDGGAMPPKPDYAAVMKKPGVALYVRFRIEEARVVLDALDRDGNVFDMYTVERP